MAPPSKAHPETNVTSHKALVFWALLRGSFGVFCVGGGFEKCSQNPHCRWTGGAAAAPPLVCQWSRTSEALLVGVYAQRPTSTTSFSRTTSAKAFLSSSKEGSRTEGQGEVDDPSDVGVEHIKALCEGLCTVVYIAIEVQMLPGRSSLWEQQLLGDNVRRGLSVVVARRHSRKSQRG